MWADETGKKMMLKQGGKRGCSAGGCTSCREQRGTLEMVPTDMFADNLKQKVPGEVYVAECDLEPSWVVESQANGDGCQRSKGLSDWARNWKMSCFRANPDNASRGKISCEPRTDRRRTMCYSWNTSAQSGHQMT